MQYLTNQFWIKWKREFMILYQERQKWHTPKRNFQVNDVVLVKDEDTPRCQWPMARIVRVFPSSDGLVRSVELVTAASKNTLKRPIQKLILLLESNIAEDRLRLGSVTGV